MAPKAARFRAADVSDRAEEQAAQEHDALLGNKQTFGSSSLLAGSQFWKSLGLFVWAVTATIGVVVLGVLYQQQISQKPNNSKHVGKRNLIFMVSDGMGPASLSMARSFRQFEEGLPINDILTLDKHLVGSSRTRSSSSLVTDSAAGATAFSCGLKSYNGAISMLPDHTPCGTILEAAKRAGYLTGLVVTTDITDATPACFASHVNMRFEQDAIALQEVGQHPLGRVVDLMLGGGRCHFLPNTTEGSCRADKQDVVKLAQDQYGWNYIQSRKEFDDLKRKEKVPLPLLGLLANTDVPFEIDRRGMSDIYPSLEEMTEVALRALEDATKDSDKGFFLMVEGSRIDHAGHGNDPAAQVHEVIAYDKAFAKVIEFIDKSPQPGVLVATSDHETGGLSVARQLHSTYPQYLWFPEALSNASHSAENLAGKLNAYIIKDGKELKKYIKHLVEDGLGILDASDAELELLYTQPLLSVYTFAEMISRRAQIGWSTHGHSAVDVNIYFYPPTASQILRGNHENIEVGNFLQDYLDLDVLPITKELRKSSQEFQDMNAAQSAWTGHIATNQEIEEMFQVQQRQRFPLARTVE